MYAEPRFDFCSVKLDGFLTNGEPISYSFAGQILANHL